MICNDGAHSTKEPQKKLTLHPDTSIHLGPFRNSSRNAKLSQSSGYIAAIALLIKPVTNSFAGQWFVTEPWYYVEVNMLHFLTGTCSVVLPNIVSIGRE